MHGPCLAAKAAGANPTAECRRCRSGTPTCRGGDGGTGGAAGFGEGLTRLFRSDGIGEPGEVARVAVRQGEDQKFRGIVGVFCDDQFFQSSEPGAGGFQEEQDFGTGFNFSAPAVMRLDFGEQVGTGNEAGLEGGAGEAAGGFHVRRGDEDEGKFGRGFHDAMRG